MTLFSLLAVLLASPALAGTPINTEDHRGGALSMEHFTRRDQILAYQDDRKSVAREKRQHRQEKRIAKLAKRLNHRIANSRNKAMAGAGSGENTMSLLSLIGGVGGFLLIFIPYIGLLGLLMAIGGLVLGLVAMKKEGSNVMNILGVVFGGLTVLLFIAAIIIVASII